MNGYTVIFDVGNTFKKFLYESLQPDLSSIIAAEDEITLLSPNETNPGKLSLFLYWMTENVHLKNRRTQQANAQTLPFAPFIVDLFYLITPHTGDTEKDQKLLGKVMQICHEHPVIRGSQLQGSLESTTEALKVIFHTLPFEEMLNLWQSFPDQSFTLSVCYQVTPVSIRSTSERSTQRVVEKENLYHLIRG